MRTLFLTLAASVLTLGGLAGSSSPAQAREHEHEGRHEGREHWEGHRYPGTWHEHEGHRDWDHDRYHEAWEHREFHRPYVYPLYQDYYYAPNATYGYGSAYYTTAPAPYDYYYPGYGFGVQGPRFSVYFGR